MEAKFGRDAEINLAGVIWIGFFRSFAVRFYVYDHFWYKYSQDLQTMTYDNDYDRINFTIQRSLS